MLKWIQKMNLGTLKWETHLYKKPQQLIPIQDNNLIPTYTIHIIQWLISNTIFLSPPNLLLQQPQYYYSIDWGGVVLPPPNTITYKSKLSRSQIFLLVWKLILLYLQYYLLAIHSVLVFFTTSSISYYNIGIVVFTI